MARARTQLKSALVMQGESTSARAGALASDWYHLGRLRTLQELAEAIDARDASTTSWTTCGTSRPGASPC